MSRIATPRPARSPPLSSRVNHVHTLLRARDWQERPEFRLLCEWWRRSGAAGVFALIGIGGAGKTAITERFLRVIPCVTAHEPDLPKDDRLPTPEGVFVFSFYDAPNPQLLFGELYEWLVREFGVVDRRPLTTEGVRRQASASVVLDALASLHCRFLLVLDGAERVQDDGSHKGGPSGELQPHLGQLAPTTYNVHPAIRDGFRNQLDHSIIVLVHEAAEAALLKAFSPLQRGTDIGAPLEASNSPFPSEPNRLELLEEAIFHALQAHNTESAMVTYSLRLGGYENLGLRLGDNERGERICRAFSGGMSAQSALCVERHTESEGQNSLEPRFPFRGLGVDATAQLINDWGQYLKDLGQLASASVCFESHNTLRRWYRHLHYLTVGYQNLAEVEVMLGHLNSAVIASSEAIHLATADLPQQWRQARACHAHILGLRGDVEAALSEFRLSLYWPEPLDCRRPPHQRFGSIWLATLLVRLGRQQEALALMGQITRIGQDRFGNEYRDFQLKLLVNAMCDNQRGRLTRARTKATVVYEWAMIRGAKDLLCWASLVRAQAAIEKIEKKRKLPTMAGSRPVRLISRLMDDASSALDDALCTVRDCGYAICHIDVLLERCRLHLLRGDPASALRDLHVALDKGVRTSTSPELLAAADPECGYAWGIATGRHLRAQALLLQSAQTLGCTTFVPAKQEEISPEVQVLIESARNELEACRKLRRQIHDPKLCDTEAVLNDLATGRLTHFPVESLSVEEITEMREKSKPLTNRVRSVFISYAHADNENADSKRQWLNRFLKFLRPFVRQEDFTVCSDRDIMIGDDWHAHIQTHLTRARAAVLLVSPDFLASDYIANNELPPLLKDAADKGVKIFPIIVAPCSYSRTKFKYPDSKKGPNEFKLSSLQAANPPSKTLVEMEEGEQNRVFIEVAEQLADLLSANP